MSEHQETVHIVLRYAVAGLSHLVKAVKAYDDRADARGYAKRMNARSMKFNYTVQSCKKG